MSIWLITLNSLASRKNSRFCTACTATSLAILIPLAASASEIGALTLASATNQSSAPVPAQTSNTDFQKGTDFKTGPITDDQKLIKPVSGDKNPSPGAGSNDKSAPSSADSSKESSHTSSHVSPKNVDVYLNEKGPISIGAVKVAKDMDMIDLVTELNELKKQQKYIPGQRVHTIEVISVRQDLSENLLAAFMQTQRVISELDRQISGYDAVARVLEEKRDQSIRNNNVLNFTSGGALAVTQGSISIGTPMNYQNTGNTLGVVAGGLTALISAYALKLQKGGKRDADRDPNMLAPIFGLTPAEPNKYPPAVWAYLNDYEPGQKKTRREQLIERWVTLHYIEPLDKSTSAHHLQQLAGTIPLKKEVNIDMLRDRIPMLEDIRAAVSGIHEYLDEILTFVRKP